MRKKEKRRNVTDVEEKKAFWNVEIKK